MAVSLLLAVPAAASPGPARLDVDPKSYTFLTDGKGHFVAVDEGAKDREKTLLYASSRKGPFYRQRIRSRRGKKGSDLRVWGFWSGRAAEAPGVGSQTHGASSKLQWKGNRWTLACGSRERTFIPVDGRTRQRLLRVPMLEGKLDRLPYLLGRDELGVYYYVDIKPGINVRFYIGKPGAMKEQRVINVITDTAGDVIGSKKGTLTRRGENLSWIDTKGQRSELFLLPKGSVNDYLIYSALGIYGHLGTPCDDI